MRRALVWRSSKVQSIETQMLEHIITWVKTNLSLFSTEPNHSLSMVGSSVLNQEPLPSFLEMSLNLFAMSMTNPYTCRSCSCLRAEKNSSRKSVCWTTILWWIPPYWPPYFFDTVKWTFLKSLGKTSAVKRTIRLFLFGSLYLFFSLVCFYRYPFNILHYSVEVQLTTVQDSIKATPQLTSI